MFILGKSRKLELMCAILAIALSGCVNIKEKLGKKEKPPILEYDFCEGAGSVLRDKSGNGNDGIIHGAEWVKSEDGYCLSFDGIDDYAETKYSPLLNLKQQFTIEITVKPGKNEHKKGFGNFSWKNIAKIIFISGFKCQLF